MLATAFAVDESYALEDVFERDAGRVYATGLQALVRLALTQARLDRANGLDTGGFISGYRGSPVAGLDLVLGRERQRLEAAGIRFQPGLNEALAATALIGSQQVEATGKGRVDGVFGLWYGKGPGVDWAGDALKHGNAYGSSPHGGVLVVAGDDHGAVSSTMAHQSDQAFQAWSMPVLNPASVADYLDLGLYGWALSRYCGAWVGFKAVSETVEGASSFELSARLPDFVTPSDYLMPAGGLHYRLVDPPSVAIESRLLAKIEAAEAFARANRPDRWITDPERARLTVLTVGRTHLDTMEALRRLGLGDRETLAALGIRILKIGQSWPLDGHAVRRAARGVETVLVVEEKRPLVEDQLKRLLYHDAGPRPRIIGKSDVDGKPLLPASGELRPHLVAAAFARAIGPLMPELSIESQLAAMQPAPLPTIETHRTPYFCSGCPHNSSTVVPDGSTAFGGIGCHIMATWMDRDTVGVTQMGGEGSNWIGLAPFVDMQHVFQNLGDGTYLHSGSLGIRAALAAGTDITFKILFNDAVAMTGGQSHDGALDVPAITRQVHAEGVRTIVVVTDQPDKYDGVRDLAPGVTVRHRRELDAVQRELRRIKGVSVLVYDQTCAAEKRRRRKRGRYPDPVKRVVINELVCEACGDCSKTSNCMSVQPLETPLGTKRQIDQSSCNKDFSCLDGFCPSFVTVEGAELKKPSAISDEALADMLAGIGHPRLPAVDAVHETLVTGIGGTGVLTVGAVIGMAAHLESRAVSVLDFTGLAQKGGAVLSHVRIAATRDQLHQARIEPGQADTLIACDLVTAADAAALTTLSAGKSRAVANAAVQATATFVSRPDYALPVARLRKRLAARLLGGSLPSTDATKLAEGFLGDSIGANMLMLGFAWQHGLLPLSYRAIERAIELNGVAVAANKRAFALGRVAAAEPDRLDTTTPADIFDRSLDSLIAQRVEHLTGYQNAAYAARYERFVRDVEAAERALRGHDPVLPLSRAVARNLFKLMAVKDEYEVARLHTDGRLRAKLDDMFEAGGRRRYHLAPPLLATIDSLLGRRGKPRKISLGRWIEPILRLLAEGKRLRGTALDPFGRTEERRIDRALLDDYRLDLRHELAGLTGAGYRRAIALAELPDMIRGFGHVRAAAVDRYRQKRGELLAPTDQTAAVAVAAE